MCEAFGYKVCQCDPLTDGNWNDERLCTLCCKDGDVCSPSSDIAAITKPALGIRGQPCYKNQGYCDALLKCRKVRVYKFDYCLLFLQVFKLVDILNRNCKCCSIAVCFRLYLLLYVRS